VPNALRFNNHRVTFQMIRVVLTILEMPTFWISAALATIIQIIWTPLMIAPLVITAAIITMDNKAKNGMPSWTLLQRKTIKQAAFLPLYLWNAFMESFKRRLVAYIELSR
jgi:hypothetical protein